MTSDVLAAVLAPAKINLSLHVTGQRADGYHLLDSLVVFADIADRLWIEPSARLRITVTGPFADGVPSDERNLIWRAAEMAGQTAHITVEKNLPHGAGIGGGSSDAAAVLRYFGVRTGAARLGADVPVCLAPQAQRMGGIGEVLQVLHPMPTVWAVLVNPGVHVPTPEVFGRLRTKENPSMPADIPAFSSAADLIQWLAQTRNDLQTPACEAAPVIADVLDSLATWKGAALPRMSGSGATCFALFENQNDAADAAASLAQAHPKWWVRACQIS